MKRRLLFVDDVPDVLRGLKRVLRPLRDEYEMEFVDSADEALEKLDAARFDVIVADMRMPRTDGAELLNHVQDRHPEVVRMILSGEAEREAVLACVGSTHQYLSKPCDPELLKASVTRACALRDLLIDENLTRLVSGVESLPSVPSTYQRVMDELQQPESSLQAVGEHIDRDVAMSAKILKLVNSSFFGLPRPVSTPAQAASLLGVDTVKALVLSIGVFSQFEQSPLPGFSLDGITQHSFVVADIARRIAETQSQDKQVQADSYLAGLLHDVGKLILAQNLPQEFGAALERSERTGLPSSKVEQEGIGASHAQIGAYLLGIWGLSDSIVEAVAFHHEPSLFPTDDFAPLTAVHIANCLWHEQHSLDCGDVSRQLDHVHLEPLGLLDRVDEFRTLQTELCEATA